MAFAYTVSVIDAAGAVDDAALRALTEAAAAQWSQYIHGFGSIDIQVTVTATTRANARAATTNPIGTSGSLTLYETSPATELQTGRDLNGAAPDILINVDPGFLAFFSLDPGSAPPTGKADGLGLMMHEIGHGLGFVSLRNPDTGAFAGAASTWDAALLETANGLFFGGATARAVHGGPVAVTTLRNGEQYSHIGNSLNEEIGWDLMNGVATVTGRRYPISDLDLAMLKDIGLPVISGVNGDPLLDPFFYAATYPAVTAARLSAVDHYNQWGWRDGLDPSAAFSTLGYRAANSDVAAAGLNPLLHFEQFGWREGRDAVAWFDTTLYLARNPDVAAIGVDPLVHYLSFGRFEGRAAYSAIGAPDSFTHGAFDAEYYLLANPDVARLALAAGGDPAARAYAQYQASGWREGRDPNSVFKVKDYLAANPDVQAAGLDPLLHYDTYGWREGRDPAAGFDTRAYLAAYADVADAGVDPLLHYLQYGALEGRSTFGDGVIA
ncbi:hypothetical protein [Roseicella frigidaeris]|uniref:Uncharacterized protein n=1 Tax=Roseicella frigidaeris TaxID=2230885 RepID=A0A327M3N4_9PROT|nr:hypothetical protein [Roseicella frigidaeris]RAI54678.1 hypothetical protein DOO78_25380 [Roseicella frigidaeris]